MSAPLLRMRSRRVAALSDKLDALAQDFDQWVARSEEHAALEKHHTQVRRLVRRLDRLRALLDEEIAGLGDTPDALGAAHVLERDVLFLHNMWEFYRAKLGQRHVPWTRRFLDLADDYAWACLEPVIKAAVNAGHILAADVREPPLVYLNGDWSPFAATRGLALMAEAIDVTETERELFRREVNALPLSVLGIPWYQLSHLPDVLILAHEVGHVVEDDLKLTHVLRTSLRTALEQGGAATRLDAWSSWMGEAFADVFGTVAGGRGFAFAMLDFVALDVNTVRTEVRDARDWGAYPTIALRADLMVAALAAMEDQDGATEVAARREALLGDVDTMPLFRRDAELVVKGWLSTPWAAFGTKTLLEVARVPRSHWADALRISRAVVNQEAITASDPRVLVSASRIAFEDAPLTYRLRDVALDAETGDPQSRLLQQFAHSRQKGTRSAAVTIRGAALIQQQQRDDAAALAMMARWRTQR